MGKGLAILQADGGLLANVGHLVEEQAGNLTEALGKLSAIVRLLPVCVCCNQETSRVSCPCVNTDGAVV